MKLNIEELAKQAGVDIYTAWGISDEVLLRYTKAVVERCAQEAEDTSQEYEAYTGQERALNYSCAAAIRNLLED